MARVQPRGTRWVLMVCAVIGGLSVWMWGEAPWAPPAPVADGLAGKTMLPLGRELRGDDSPGSARRVVAVEGFQGGPDPECRSNPVESVPGPIPVSDIEVSARLSPDARVPCPSDFSSEWFRCHLIAEQLGVDLPESLELHPSDWATIRRDFGPMLAALNETNHERVSVLNELAKSKVARGEVRYFPALASVTDPRERARLAREMDEASRPSDRTESAMMGGDGERQWVMKVAAHEDPRLHVLVSAYWQRAEELIPQLEIALARMPKGRPRSNR
jgi:hypothetical protein